MQAGVVVLLLGCLGSAAFFFTRARRAGSRVLRGVYLVLGASPLVVLAVAMLVAR